MLFRWLKPINKIMMSGKITLLKDETDKPFRKVAKTTTIDTFFVYLDKRKYL